ncbi:MAG: Binding-protein-dependent transport system inner rane component [Pseudomonadota bacterium]|jgi:ABC-type sugar transport system permease subunit
MARVVFQRRFFRSDWPLFTLFVTATLLVALATGWSMRGDERRAARERAAHVGRSVAGELARMAVTPGADFEGTLPGLAAALGEGVRLGALHFAPATADTPAGWQDLGRTDTDAKGLLADPNTPEGRGIAARAAKAVASGPQAPVVVWVQGKLTVLAAAEGEGRRVVGLVEGVEPPDASSRWLVLPLVAAAMLLLFAAGFHDILPRVGPVLNGIALVLVAAVLVALGAALHPSLWRGGPSAWMVDAATGLRLADLARALAADLPVPMSRVLVAGLPLSALAVGLYLLGLFKLWHRIASAVRRDAQVWRMLLPAALLLVALVLVPVLASVALGLVRATPTGVRWVGWEQLKQVAGPDSVTSPLGLWQGLAWTLLMPGVSLAVQLVLADLAAASLRRIAPVWRSALRPAILLPWLLSPGVAVFVLRTTGAPLLQLFAGDEFGPRLLLPLVVSLWVGLPVTVLLMEEAFRALPAACEEAAMLEGASYWQRRMALAPFLRSRMRVVQWACLVLALSSATLAQWLQPASAGDYDLLTTRAMRWALESDEFGKGALFGTVAFAIVLGGALLLGQDIRKGERA